MRADVLLFLTSLRTYLYGDLDSFKKVCLKAELEEARAAVPASSPGSMSGGTHSASTTLTTTSPTGNAVTPSLSGNIGSSGTSGPVTPSKLQETRFRSTVPHALAVLSAMDVLGFLIGTEANANATEKNLTMFLNSSVTDPDQLNCLVFIYRHGMSHSFFPKVNIAVAAHSILEGKPLFILDSKGVITLNVNRLIEIVKVKFDAIIADTPIHPNIVGQFDKLVTTDQTKLANKGLNLTAFAATLTTI